MKIICILAGAILAFFLNYSFLERIIIPDPCYYHARKTTKLFDLFYMMIASDGYHPFPTVFNLIFTIATGGLVGYMLYKLIERRNKKRSVKEWTAVK